MEKPVFSIIVPAFNVVSYIEQTLLSIYNQTYKNHEIIIIDDGSTDGTSELLSKQTDTRLRILRQQNSGVSAARNRGIQESSGEFIAFLDGDDVWVCNHLEIALKFFRNHPEYDWFYTKPKPVQSVNQKHLSEGIRGTVTYKAVNWFTDASNIPISSSCIIRKTAIPSDTLFPLGVKMYEDNVAWSRIAMLSPMIGFANCSTVQYRMRDSSASHHYSVNRLGRDSCFNNALMYHQELYIDKECSPEAKLFFQFYSLNNWWGRIRGSSLITWKEEISQRKALNGPFLTSWLLIGAYLNHFFCLCYAKMVRFKLNAVVRKMASLSPLYEIELGTEDF